MPYARETLDNFMFPYDESDLDLRLAKKKEAFHRYSREPIVVLEV